MNRACIDHEMTMNLRPGLLGNLSEEGPFHGCKGRSDSPTQEDKDMKQLSAGRYLVGILTLSLMAALFVPVALAGDEVHLRIEVTDENSGEMKVNLDMPLGAIESILDILTDQVHGDFNMDFGHHGVDVRRIYMALRDEDMSDFLEINSGEEHVKVWKDRDAFQVRVTREGAPRPVAMVYLPLPLLDALFSGPDESLPNLKGALKELEHMAPLTLVEVFDEDETVRIWLE